MPLDFDSNYDPSKPVKNISFGHVLDEMMAEDPELINSLQFGVYKRADSITWRARNK